MNRPIRFSHYYNKMPSNIKTAVLLGVEAWDVEKLPASFKDYDTEYFSGESDTKFYYPLQDKGKVIVLFLWGEVGGGVHFLFTTIRRCTEEKWDYYHGKVGEEFPIEVKEERD